MGIEIKNLHSLSRVIGKINLPIANFLQRRISIAPTKQADYIERVYADLSMNLNNKQGKVVLFERNPNPTSLSGIVASFHWNLVNKDPSSTYNCIKLLAQHPQANAISIARLYRMYLVDILLKNKYTNGQLSISNISKIQELLKVTKLKDKKQLSTELTKIELEVTTRLAK